MPRYGCVHDLTAAPSTTAPAALWLPNATTPRRLKLSELTVGSAATPADVAFKYTVQRTTATTGATGGSTVTPAALDPADAAATFQALTGTFTQNPSLGATVLSVAMNGRATIRWVAPPGGELVAPATVNVGLALMTPVATAQAVTATSVIEE